jgi:hypothetical protein
MVSHKGVGGAQIGKEAVSDPAGESADLRLDRIA